MEPITYASTRQEESLLQPIHNKSLPNLKASNLIITKITTPKDIPKPSKLKFGKFTTDHMLMVHWDVQTGWQTPEILPYQALSLDPTASVLHYGLECYEGMKAFRDARGGMRLFRPQKNMSRLNQSAQRIGLPSVDERQLLSLIKTFVRLEERFVPSQKGYSLYIRPCMIGTNRNLGLSAPTSALLFVIASPVGPYYEKQFEAISLTTISSMSAIRAWPGGVGNKKIGGNYAPCIVPEANARSRGCQQVLWLFGEEEYVTEVGAMNFFVVLRNKTKGTYELRTAPLDGTILDGVTRDCVLNLARERLDPKDWVVRERRFTMNDLRTASQSGDLIEAFGTGTAAVVTPVRMIEWRGQQVSCGLEDGQDAGTITKLMRGWIEGIQCGEIAHEWSVPLTTGKDYISVPAQKPIHPM